MNLENSPGRLAANYLEWFADSANGIGKILFKARTQLDYGHTDVAELHYVKTVLAVAEVFATKAEHRLAQLHQTGQVGLHASEIGMGLFRLGNCGAGRFNLRESVVAIKVENMRRAADRLKRNPIDGHSCVPIGVRDLGFNGHKIRNLTRR